MKTRVVIGDPHGRWGFVKQIYDNVKPDEVIILGDYFDSFNIDAYTQRECYENGKGDFVMLIGNHDFHYMDEKFGRCSGWNPLTCSQADYPLCRDWENGILKFVHIDYKNFTIYSHAGVSQKWFDSWCKNKELEDINSLPTKAFCFTFKEGGDYYGSSVYNSPLWIRPEGLMKSPFTDHSGGVWNQVFGHTEPNTPIHWKQEFEDYTADFYGIDCIYKHYLIEYLDDNGKLLERKLGDVMS